MFYVQDGNVKVTVTAKRGKRAVLAILRQGDFFGERCFVSRSLRTSTATAIHQSTIARVKRTTIARIMQQEPAFAKLVILYLLSRIVRIEEDFVDQILHSSEKRLARILLLLARSGRQSKSKAGMKVSQQTLAEMVGTTRSRVSFFMNGFRKRGFIRYKGACGCIGDCSPSHCGSKRYCGSLRAHAGTGSEQTSDKFPRDHLLPMLPDRCEHYCSDLMNPDLLRWK
jgi:CRP/FNR family transcriptional regulator, cyclic AMP receptor protein